MTESGFIFLQIYTLFYINYSEYFTFNFPIAFEKMVIQNGSDGSARTVFYRVDSSKYHYYIS